MSRYDRQMRLPEIGSEGQARLAQSQVLVAGAGGLGAALLPLLAGAGVGHITLYDPDTVAESNLHRQTLYRMSDLGRPKAEVAAETLARLNPDCHIAPRAEPLLSDSAADAVGEADLVIDAADRVTATYALSDLCHATNTPFISAAVTGRAGHVGGFCGGAPSYRAVFPDMPPTLTSCDAAGVMGPAVATLGALQAQMALSVLLGLAPSPLGQMLTLDLAGWRIGGFRFDEAPEPETNGPAILAVSQLSPTDLVIDLRSRDEAPVPATPQAQRLPEGGLSELNGETGQRVVFACATGLRAWRAAQDLRAAGGIAAILAT
ncbi:HesA/MoeB/ThiF family protein [Salipiger bermudensis]|uniref:HesA/MoeB/ThiF family protein n=1 Tax=Salipiger bermudensis TaxID=344736 RepID=UPI001A8E8108|nr:HesA/MoeB/ThiF family protein [Salipiger bermudensis]MBN9677301.1 HesA/MoeB/ThiF family protein [Salipiger bermudensis]